MRNEIKSANIFAPKWYNPLFYLVIILAPVIGLAVGSVTGSVCGLLIGYEKGLEAARNKLHKLTVKLP